MEGTKHYLYEVIWCNPDCILLALDYPLGKALDIPQQKLYKVWEALVMSFVKSVRLKMGMSKCLAKILNLFFDKLRWIIDLSINMLA